MYKRDFINNLRIFKWIVLLWFVHSCKGSEEGPKNILVAVPVASKSLHNLFSAVGINLAKQGHSVTLFSSFNESYFHPNLTHFQPGDFSSPLQVIENVFEPMSISALSKWIRDANAEIVPSFWNNDEVKEFYRNRQKFDAIIYPSYANEVFMPFLDDFEGVSILLCTPGIEYNSIARYGNWLSLSVAPILILPYDDHMNFSERSYNLFTFYVLDIYFRNFVIRPFLRDMQIYFPDFKYVDSYYERSSLTLINGHFALDGPVPLLPNQVEIGTINAQKPKPLPKDLEKFINDSGDAGIIYFSLGSFIMGEEIPSNIKEILVETFRKLPQRVIWKYEGTDLDLPSNVLTRKWLPQQDILGHPKTKIFMSHCGNLGTQEAKFHGVPVLAVPIAFDQPRNAARLERKKYGVIVNWSDMTVDSLLEAVHTLSKDSSYYDRMKKVSKILQDQKDSPGERAVWWVEYVIRHKGAPHLRYAGQDLSFYQYIMLDVIAFWSIILGAIVFAFVYVFKMIWRKCIRSSKTKKE